MRMINKLNNYMKLAQMDENDNITVKLGKFNYIELPEPDKTVQCDLNIFKGF